MKVRIIKNDSRVGLVIDVDPRTAKALIKSGKAVPCSDEKPDPLTRERNK